MTDETKTVNKLQYNGGIVSVDKDKLVAESNKILSEATNTANVQIGTCLKCGEQICNSDAMDLVRENQKLRETLNIGLAMVAELKDQGICLPGEVDMFEDRALILKASGGKKETGSCEPAPPENVSERVVPKHNTSLWIATNMSMPRGDQYRVFLCDGPGRVEYRPVAHEEHGGSDEN